MMNLVTSVLVLGVLIMVHELGHFLAAKANGVKVHEFAVGFGPKLWSTKRGETEYSVRLFVFLGGFNRMAGLESDQGEEEASDQGRKFSDKTIWQRAAIIAAGPFSNYLLAVVLFALVFGPVGLVRPVDNQPIIGRIIPGKPAAEAGLVSGDRVVSIDGNLIPTWEALVGNIQSRLGKTTSLVVERDGRSLEFRVIPTPNDADPRVGMIGVDVRRHLVRLGPIESLQAAVRQTAAMTTLWFTSISQMITGHAPADVVGPVGIIKLVEQASAVGMATLLSLAGALSVTLGIINLLPFPALDGGRLVFLAVEKLRGRPVDPNRENFIHFIGFALLMLLALFISLKDIQRLSA